MSLFARTRTATIPLQGEGTVMELCLGAGLPVGRSCAGRVACARCAVTVESGGEALSPPDDEEQRVLARAHAQPHARLACACRVVDPRVDVVVTAGYW